MGGFLQPINREGRTRAVLQMSHCGMFMLAENKLLLYLSISGMALKDKHEENPFQWVEP